MTKFRQMFASTAVYWCALHMRLHRVESRRRRGASELERCCSYTFNMFKSQPRLVSTGSNGHSLALSTSTRLTGGVRPLWLNARLWHKLKLSQTYTRTYKTRCAYKTSRCRI